MKKITKFLIEIIKQASELVEDVFEVKNKDDAGDLVTSCDFKIEKFLIEKIKEVYPKFDIVSEEFNENNKQTQNCFVIDPIDGTINFAQNVPFWVIQVACVKGGEVCSSVVYCPKLNELFYADETGAFLNGNKIYVSKNDDTFGIYEILDSSKIFDSKKVYEGSKYCRKIYCTGLAFCWVACGRFSGAVLTKDTLWDYLPGLYIAKQAGAVIVDETKLHMVSKGQNFVEFLKGKLK